MVTALDKLIPEAGQVWWVYLGPFSGTEQDGRRPFLVLSPKELNELTGRIIGVSIASKIRGWETEVPIFGLSMPCVAQPDQIRTLDYRSRKAEFRGNAVLNAELEAVRKVVGALTGIQA